MNTATTGMTTIATMPGSMVIRGAGCQKYYRRFYVKGVDNRDLGANFLIVRYSIDGGRPLSVQEKVEFRIDIWSRMRGVSCTLVTSGRARSLLRCHLYSVPPPIGCIGAQT
jgi:hypothetical protein